MKIILLLFSLALVPLSAMATCTTDTPKQLLRAVHDTDGNPLQVNTSDLDKGIAVYFRPKEPKHQEIVESSSLNINFYLDYYECANLTVWKVDNYPKPPKHNTISTGAKLGNPLDVNIWFQIKSLGGSTYKLVFCPYGEKFTCQNVGIAEENGYSRLVLAENAKAFVFIKHGGIGKAEA
ncbi:hypothetical protein A4A49_60422 [Nicotiana attenuata]|uniref:21 kDa seed protein n=1 Tax=Nicotiana attenuata TaxID=49451 RepID=A0A314L1G7_NICAT|nr:hypothetical protein A4A49_60422 [Nicotiana attenuata]